MLILGWQRESLEIFSFFFSAEMANSLKRLSKTCLILGEAVNSADLANRALEIYNETYGNMRHREVCANHLYNNVHVFKRIFLQ